MSDKDENGIEEPGVCRECGFVVPENLDYCPDCGLLQEETSFWSKLTSKKPKRSESNLRGQQERIGAEMQKMERDAVRLGQQHARVKARLDAARAAGRGAAALERSLQGVETALEQRQKLRVRYRALSLAIRLDRLDSEHQRRSARWADPGALSDLVSDLRGRRTLVCTLEGKNTKRQVNRLAYGPDGRHLAAAYGDRAGATSESFLVSMWDTAMRLSTHLHSGIRARYLRLAFDPVGRFLALTGNASETHAHWGTNATGTNPGMPTGLQRKALMMDLTGRTAYWMPPDDPTPAAGIAFAPHNNNLFWLSAAGRVRVVRLPEQVEATSWTAHSGRASDLAISPDGQVLATVGRRDGLKLWNPWAPVVVPLAVSHGEGGLHCVTFSPDGRYLAVGGMTHVAAGEATVRVWDMRDLSRLAAYFRTSGEVWDLAFSPDGRYLAAADGKGLALWAAGSWTDLDYIQGGGFGVWTCDFSSWPDGLAMGAGPDVQIHSMESPALVRLRQDLRSLEDVLSDADLDSVAEGRKLRMRATQSATRALELCVSQLHRWSSYQGRTAGGAAAVLAGLDEVLAEAGRMHQVLAAHPLTADHAGSSTELLASLLSAALRPVVDQLMGAVESFFSGLAEADEEECDRRMEGLEQQRQVALQILGQLDGLSPEVAATAAVEQIRDAVQATLDQIPELQDLVVARQTAASLGEYSPIMDAAPASELSSQREALQALDADQPMALLPEPDLPPLTPVLDLLNEREDVLQSIEEEYQRLDAEVEAARDVDRIAPDD